MKREQIGDVIIHALEKALEDTARPGSAIGSPDMMHRLLLARLSGALSYHADMGNKKAGRAAALIAQFDETYERAAKAEGGAA